MPIKCAYLPEKSVHTVSRTVV